MAGDSITVLWLLAHFLQEEVKLPWAGASSLVFQSFKPGFHSQTASRSHASGKQKRKDLYPEALDLYPGNWEPSTGASLPSRPLAAREAGNGHAGNKA